MGLGIPWPQTPFLIRFALRSIFIFNSDALLLTPRMYVDLPPHCPQLSFGPEAQLTVPGFTTRDFLRARCSSAFVFLLSFVPAKRTHIVVFIVATLNVFFRLPNLASTFALVATSLWSRFYTYTRSTGGGIQCRF
jgi:hypothetical protein